MAVSENDASGGSGSSGRARPGFRLSSLFSRPSATASGESDSVLAVPADPALKPSRMRGAEPLYGYVVVLELLVVAILNLTITSGKGAPAHPQTTLAIIGVAAALALAAVIQTKNRMAAGFSAIIAAFFVTLPRVPNSMSVAHIFALVIPMAYGLIITQRQRKDTPKAMRGRAGATAGSAGGSAPNGRGGRGGRASGASAPSAAGGRRKGKTPEPVAGPRPNARYTPPKAKRKPAK